MQCQSGNGALKNIEKCMKKYRYKGRNVRVFPYGVHPGIFFFSVGYNFLYSVCNRFDCRKRQKSRMYTHMRKYIDI